MSILTDTPPCPDLSLIHRFTVDSVVTLNLPNELTLILASSSPYKFRCILQGQWAQTKVNQGDIINVRTSKWEGAFVVDSSSGFIVVNPDYLITCTAIATSLFCPRKAWLNDKFKGWGAGNEVMLVGTIVHELLQECCMKKIYQEDKIYKLMDEMLQNQGFIIEAYACEMTQESLKTKVAEYIPWIYEFIQKYVVVEEASELHESPRTKLKILEVLDIEDNIWCRYFGVKGKVDFTVKVKLYGSDFSVKNKVLPMELKTGKVSFSSEHTAQATLYTLMMDNRQYGACDSSLLLYLKDGPKLKQICLPASAKHTLIQRRNDYEFMMRKWSDGPDFKDCDRLCPKCDHLLDCSLMAKNFEEDKFFDTKVQENIATAALAHLSGIEIQFFGDWIKKLNNRAGSNRSWGDFWNTQPHVREEAGTSLGKMVILRHKKFTYTFVRSEKYAKGMKALSESLKPLNGRERVALSLDEENTIGERDMIAILIGFVEKIENDSITLTFDKSLQKDLMSKIFRVDLIGRGSYSSVMPFNNLLRLMMPEDEICQKLRQTIIGGDPPSYTKSIPRNIADSAKQLLSAPSNSRALRMAVANSLTTSHYLLIKYTCHKQKLKFVRFLLKLVNAWKKRILIVAADTATLDATLVHLVENGIENFVRLGSTTKLDPRLETFSSDFKLAEVKKVSDVEKIYKGKCIASTFYSLANHVAFENSPEDFEYCIMDQADQVSLPMSLGPLFRSKRFILIGRSSSSCACACCFSSPSGSSSSQSSNGLKAGSDSVSLSVSVTVDKSASSPSPSVSQCSVSSQSSSGCSSQGSQGRTVHAEISLLSHLEPVSKVIEL